MFFLASCFPTVVFFHALGFREVNAVIFLGRDINELVGGSRCFFIFTTIPGEMILFDKHMFQMGWFNHQLDEG